LIEVNESMSDLLILKSVTDGFNLILCSAFSENGDHHVFENSDFEKT